MISKKTEKVVYYRFIWSTILGGFAVTIMLFQERKWVLAHDIERYCGPFLSPRADNTLRQKASKISVRIGAQFCENPGQLSKF
jgi:hypothetical protein